MSERLPAVYFDAAFTQVVSDQVILAALQPAASSSGWANTQDVFLLIADISAVHGLQLVTRVEINDELAFDRAGAPPYFQPAYNGPGSSFTVRQSPGSGVNDVHQLNIDYKALWESGSTIKVRVKAESTGGYVLDEVYYFTVRDTVAPEVVDVAAVSPTRVEVTFNEPMLMDASSGGALNPANYAIDSDDSPAYLPDSFTVEQITNYRIAIVTDAELSHGRTYELTIQNVQDTSGNTLVTTVESFVAAALLEGDDREFDMWRMIPLRIRRRDRALTGGSPGDTEKLLGCLQEVADLLWYDTDLLRLMYDIDLAPMDSINLLLEQFGNPFRLDLTDLQKRKLLRNLIAIYREKGTEQGIIDAIFFFLGIPVTITKLLARSWRLGYHKLGTTTRLGPSGSAARFTFWVNSPVALTTDERKAMDDVIKLMKVGHEHHIIVEPIPPPPLTWRLGYHKLGTETRLGG